MKLFRVVAFSRLPPPSKGHRQTVSKSGFELHPPETSRLRTGGVKIRRRYSGGLNPGARGHPMDDHLQSVFFRRFSSGETQKPGVSTFCPEAVLYCPIMVSCLLVMRVCPVDFGRERCLFHRSFSPNVYKNGLHDVFQNTRATAWEADN